MYSSCVHPKKPIAIEIIEHTGAAVLGFSGHVRDVDFVSMVLWRVLPDSVRRAIGDYRHATSDRRSSTKDA
jgi:hypothetical protein